MKKFEQIIVVLSIIALVLNLFFIPFGAFLTVLTLSALSMIYFYFSFALFNGITLKNISKRSTFKDIGNFRIIFAVFVGIALSSAVLGILFKFQSWPMSSFFLLVGFTSILIVSIVGLIKYSKDKSFYFIKIFKRSALFGGLSIILMLFGNRILIDFKYRDYPSFVVAAKNAKANPGNRELRDKADEERQKVNLERRK